MSSSHKRPSSALTPAAPSSSSSSSSSSSAAADRRGDGDGDAPDAFRRSVRRKLFAELEALELAMHAAPDESRAPLSELERVAKEFEVAHNALQRSVKVPYGAGHGAELFQTLLNVDRRLERC